MRYSFALAFAAALAAIDGASPANAQTEPVQIKFAIPTPPQSSVSRGLQPWAEEMAKVTDGPLQVQLFLGPTVATIFNAYDRVINGVVDIAFGNFGPLASQFPKTAVVTLPFESRTGKESTLGVLAALRERHHRRRIHQGAADRAADLSRRLPARQEADAQPGRHQGAEDRGAGQGHQPRAGETRRDAGGDRGGGVLPRRCSAARSTTWPPPGRRCRASSSTR